MNLEVIQADQKQETELLVLGMFEDDLYLQGIHKEIDEALHGILSQMLGKKEFTGKERESQWLPTYGHYAAERILLLGLGKRGTAQPRTYRLLGGKIEKQRKNSEKVMVALSTFKQDPYSTEEIAQWMAEGLELATYVHHGLKTSAQPERTEAQILFQVSEDDAHDVQEALSFGQVLAEGINLTRRLVNTPANYMRPKHLVQEAEALAKRYGMELEILEESKMEEMGMDALLSVGRGSTEPSYCVVLKYRGCTEWDNVLGLVGKGVCIDTGGYSLKPGNSMADMYTDMGGAATVLGTMEVIARQQLPINVVGVIGAVENMIDGNAFKPGDVISSLAGKSIEINNTDAEGRLVLADCVTYARQLGASYLVDMATLTGGILVALGDQVTGVMSNDEAWVEELLEAAHEADEYAWRLPIFPVHRDMLKSSQADLVNSAGRLAHPITAGAFIESFVGETPWIHLDIAGTATTNKENEIQPKGATGAMVRTLVTLAQHFSQEETD
ncbi:leucyl aminopeptidase [Rubeoparvulum massiliense]|uniref:leucyl aminopeptidase n=1 Tax=Rubeoparvulum massiliense TaxID=1631346 RepID=UPI00069E8330|nr:leucyl aminopeptidase [Rubeoparvulum massiliense]